MGGSVSLVDGHIDEVLKPCPFCGGESEIGFRLSCYNHWKPEGFFPRCKDTKCIGRTYRKYHTEKEAIEAWNRRADT